MSYCPARTTPLHSGMTMLSICTAYNTIQCYAKLYYNITYNNIALCCLVYSSWHHTIAKKTCVCVQFHKFNRNSTYMEDGSSMGLSFTITKTCATTCKHNICVYETRDILHNAWHLQHHMTYNTWYLYAHRCTHLWRACCFAINTVQYLYLSVYICISLYMCSAF